MNLPLDYLVCLQLSDKVLKEFNSRSLVFTLYIFILIVYKNRNDCLCDKLRLSAQP